MHSKRPVRKMISLCKYYNKPNLDFSWSSFRAVDTSIYYYPEEYVYFCASGFTSFSYLS